MLEKLSPANNLYHVIEECVNAASNSLTALSQLSDVDKFYWHFIASCCNHVHPNPENLSKLNKHLSAVEKLSVIFHKYCANKGKKSIIYEVPEEIAHILNADVKSYFEWIIEMQKFMINWQSKFMDENFNYDDIFIYADNMQDINAFAKSVCAEHLVYSADEISKLKEDYSAIYADLCSLLVKSNKENDW